MKPNSYLQISKRNNHGLKIEKGRLFCNYFPLLITKPIQNIYVFHIQVSPVIPIEKLALRTRILSMLETEFSRIITKPIISGLQIYSHHQPKANEKMFESGQYRIFVKLSRVIKVGQKPQLLTHVLEAMIRNLMTKKNYNLLCKSKKYFDMKKKVQHYAVNVYSGFHVDFLKSQNLFYLRIDSSRKIVCSQTALDAIQYCYKICRQRDREERRRFIKQKLIGRTVMANYGKNRFYKIKDISFQCLQFERLQDSRPLAEYYEQKYGIDVKNLSQPLLVISNKKLQKQNKKCFLIPELCFMVGFPEDIDEIKQRNILSAMKLQPEQSRNETVAMVQDLSEQVEQWKSMQKLGIILNSKSMPEIEYKKFPKPTLELGNNLKVEKGLQTFFNIACRPIYKVKSNLNCTILYFNRNDISYLESVLEKNSQDTGIAVKFTKFEMGELNNNKALSQVETSIIKACQQFKPNILLLIIPTILKSYYRKIKKFCLIDKKIHSQFLTETVLTHRHNITIFGKILLQMFAKCGNILWIPRQAFTTERKIILMAFEASKVASQIIISTCCTLDNTYYAGFSKFGFCNQSNLKSGELMQVMVKNTIDCLEHYAKKNNQYPDEIILMSKSGSISIPQSFLEDIIKTIKKQLKQLYEGKQLFFTYILVETKDSSKFFIYDNPYSKARNAEIGTVVDERIVKKNQFLAITQATPGVSAVPVRFKILEENTKLERAMIQQLMFNQCFFYANYTGLVQIPAILQYAKKCAQFVSQAPFQQKLDVKIEQTPFYL